MTDDMTEVIRFTSYFESLSDLLGISVRDLRAASIRQRAALLTPAECARQLRTIADTDTQMFISEREMMRRAAALLDGAVVAKGRTDGR